MVEARERVAAYLGVRKEPVAWVVAVEVLSEARREEQIIHAHCEELVHVVQVTLAAVYGEEEPRAPRHRPGV